jgi:hypothetical protein
MTMKRSLFAMVWALAFATQGNSVDSGSEESEEDLSRLGQLLAERSGYPSAVADPRWLIEAAGQDRRMARVMRVEASSWQSFRSPLALAPGQATSLGPQPFQSISGEHSGGRVNAIAIDPVDGNVAYVGSVGGGIWKTANCCAASTTWVPATDALPRGLAIADIAIDPGNPSVVYAGTGDPYPGLTSMGTAGVLKSMDRGATWVIKGEDVFGAAYPSVPGTYPAYQVVMKVRVDPRDSNNLVVGTRTGLFFSHDGGDHWTGPCLTNAFPTQRQDTTGLLVADNGSATDLYVAIGIRGFAGGSIPDGDQNGANGVYKSAFPAAGCPAAWQPLTRGWPSGTAGGRPYPANVLGRIDLAMAPSDPKTIYAQVSAIDSNSRTQRGGQLGVWRTSDGGLTWSQRSGPSGLAGCDGDSRQNDWNQGLAVDPNHPDVVFLGTRDLFKSTDGGVTFVNQTCAYHGGRVHADQHAIAFVPGSSSAMLIGNDGGVYFSGDADREPVTFAALNDSLGTIEFFGGDITADFANSDQPGISGGTQDNGSGVLVWDGIPAAATWQEHLGGDGYHARIEPKQGQRWYMSSNLYPLTVSTAGPMGPQFAVTGHFTREKRNIILPYEIDKFHCPGATCDHLVLGTYQVWEALNGGLVESDWVAVSPVLIKNAHSTTAYINALSFAPSDGSIVAAATNDGSVHYGTDLGTGKKGTWIDLTGGNTTLPDRPILGIVIAPDSARNVYVAAGGFDQNTPSTPGHVFLATCTGGCQSEAGWNWSDKTGNLPNIPAEAIQINPRFPRQAFVGTDWGLYFTDDITVAFPTWFKFMAGLPAAMIWELRIDRGAGADPVASSTTLAIFTRGRGAYALPLPDGPISVSDVVFVDGFEELNPVSGGNR